MHEFLQDDDEKETVAAGKQDPSSTQCDCVSTKEVAFMQGPEKKKKGKKKGAAVRLVCFLAGWTAMDWTQKKNRRANTRFSPKIMARLFIFLFSQSTHHHPNRAKKRPTNLQRRGARVYYRSGFFSCYILTFAICYCSLFFFSFLLPGTQPACLPAWPSIVHFA